MPFFVSATGVVELQLPVLIPSPREPESTDMKNHLIAIKLDKYEKEGDRYFSLFWKRGQRFSLHRAARFRHAVAVRFNDLVTRQVEPYSDYR